MRKRRMKAACDNHANPCERSIHEDDRSRNQELVSRDADTVIDVKGVSISLNGTVLIHDVAFSITRRTVSALIGPCGSGKSVLLKSFTRLMDDELPQYSRVSYSGQIEFEGRNLLCESPGRLNETRRQISYVAQKPFAFPMTIIGNIMFAVSYWNPQLSKKDKVEISVEAIKQASLWNECSSRLHEPASVLSDGQLQRLSIARSLAIGAQILLLDEPCAFIDPRNTSLIEDLLFDLKQTKTVVIVTHNMQQAARVSEWCAFIEGGRIVETGSTSTLFTNPEKDATRDYIGG